MFVNQTEEQLYYILHITFFLKHTIEHTVVPRSYATPS